MCCCRSGGSVVPAPQYAFLVMVRVEVDICIYIYWYLLVCGGRGGGGLVDKCGWSHWASRTCISRKARFSLFSSAIVMVRMYVAVF